MDRIEIPGNKVSSLVFGGPDLNVLIVFTEYIGFDINSGGFDDGKQATEGSGIVYQLRDINATGFPSRKICL